LAEIFDGEIVPMLQAPGLRPVAIFEEMQRRHPELSPGIRLARSRQLRYEYSFIFLRDDS